MKATGIVRRIDSLGRLVIPKEIRTKLKVRDNEAFEIYISKDGTSVIFKKYMPYDEEDWDCAFRIASALYDAPIALYDCDGERMAASDDIDAPEDVSKPEAEKNFYEIAGARDVYGYISTDGEEPTTALKALVAFFDEG